MSSISFHTQDETIDDATVSGCERAMFGARIYSLFDTMLGLHTCDIDWIRTLLPESSYCKDDFSDNFLERLRVWMRCGDGTLMVEGEQRLVWSLAMNTAMRFGSDEFHLAARLHGQCELHAYVEGPNRAWFASKIEQGLASSFLRPDMGWESVSRLLRRSEDAPVVTSYSVCESFPNGWDDLPFAEQWRLAMDGLRSSNEKHWFEMEPLHWDNYHFGDGLHALDVRKE